MVRDGVISGDGVVLTVHSTSPSKLGDELGSRIACWWLGARWQGRDVQGSMLGWCGEGVR